MNTSEWFTEFCDENGSAFSLRIKQKCESIKTPYQQIEIYETTDYGFLMVIDGFIMLSSKDNFFYHEIMVHPAIFTHPAPQDVVIIGGGDCGSLQEALKHPVKTVTQVDIDQQVTNLSQKYFPELCQSNSDPRASLLFEDGISWMKNKQPNSVDVIIIDSTDPLGPSEGLFNKSFYQDCFNALRSTGIIIQQSGAPLTDRTLTRDMRFAMKEAGFTDLLTIPFPQSVYPSGWWGATMASKNLPFYQYRRDSSLLHSLNTKYYHFPVHEAFLHPVPLLQNIDLA